MRSEEAIASIKGGKGGPAWEDDGITRTTNEARIRAFGEPNDGAKGAEGNKTTSITKQNNRSTTVNERKTRRRTSSHTEKRRRRARSRMQRRHAVGVGQRGKAAHRWVHFEHVERKILRRMLGKRIGDAKGGKLILLWRGMLRSWRRRRWGRWRRRRRWHGVRVKVRWGETVAGPRGAVRRSGVTSERRRGKRAGRRGVCSGSELAKRVERRVRGGRGIVGVLRLLTARFGRRRLGVGGASGAYTLVDGNEGKRAGAAIESLDAILLLTAVGFGMRTAAAPRAEGAVAAAVTVLGRSGTGVGNTSAGTTLARGWGTRGSGPLCTGGRGGAGVSCIRFVIPLARAKRGWDNIVSVGETILKNKIGISLANLGQIQGRLKNGHKGGTEGLDASNENIKLGRMHGRGGK